ncbi:DUF504 domain-containing protein [uncultured Methanofollis sp.]|uniref:DUF504 domain-containing protein n=1 Tax=uncultured Methanofollis sp. TaxID=262500 RepID=UPI0026268E64|nr:DUF504 domain-containing protein [uncultured Methanofollis sp.]
MRTSHRLLLRFLHDPAYDFSAVAVVFIDRGAPGDCSRVCGRDIAAIEGAHMVVETDRGQKYIPFHRVLRVLYRDEVVWEREGFEP